MDQNLLDEVAHTRPDLAPARRVRRVSAVQQVYERLRGQIINLKLPPGTPIAKRDVATEFGVSQTPVREALLRLAEEGLVDIFPQSGTLVSLIDVQKAWETHFLRLSIEVEVQRVLAESIDDDGMAELRSLVDRQVIELNSGKESAFKQADNLFHDTLFRLAGVEGLSQLLETHRGHYDRIRGLYLRQHERRETVVEEHNVILAALEDRDASAAEAGVRQHLGKSLALVDEIRAHHPDFFLSEKSQTTTKQSETA